MPDQPGSVTIKLSNKSPYVTPAAESKVSFPSGATSSRIPRYDLIPYAALIRVAGRFALGEVNHGPKSWNALSSQAALEDREFIIARAAHVIHHAYKLIAKLSGQLPEDDDDDAAAIAWGGVFLCEATKNKLKDAINEMKCVNCGHIESDHYSCNSLIGNFKKGECMRKGCKCKGYTSNEHTEPIHAAKEAI